MTPDPNSSVKASRYKWEAANWWCSAYTTQIGGVVHILLLPRLGHTLAEVSR